MSYVFAGINSMYSVFIINGENALEKLADYDDHNAAIEGYLEFAFDGVDQENDWPVLGDCEDQYYATIFLDRLKAPFDGVFSVSVRSGHSCSYAVMYVIEDGSYKHTEIKRL
jgi:hypothetical protein